MPDKNTTNSNAYLAFDANTDFLPIRLKEVFSPTYFDTNAFIPSGISTTAALSVGQTSMVTSGDNRVIFAANVVIAFSNVAGSTLYTISNSTYDGTNTTVTFAPALLSGVALGTPIFTYGVTRTRYNDLAIGSNMVASLVGNVLTLNSTGGGGGGGSNPLVNIGTSYVADNSLISVKVNQSAPQLTVNGSVGVVADFSSVTITSTWPPTIPAGYNRNYVFIADSTNLSWAGVGLVNASPASITNISWIKPPLTAGAFTGAGVWYASNMVSTVYTGTSVSNALQNNTTMLVLPEPTITDLGANSDTFGGSAKQVTYQPFIDGRIAALIGSYPLPPNAVLTNTNGQVNSYVGATRVFNIAPVNANIVSALLALGNGIVQNSNGAWILPTSPIDVSLTANPVAGQLARITQILQSVANMQITVTADAAGYFVNATYPTNLFILLEQFVFQPQPLNAIDSEVRRLRNTPSTVSAQLTYGYRLQGDTSNFTTQILEAGSNIFFDTDPATSQPRINATIPFNLGRGWIFSIDWSPNNFPVVAGWTGNQAIPRMLRNGTIVPTTGINATNYWGAVRTWVGGGTPALADTQYVANQYAAWHNSFSDSLTVTVLVEDGSGRFQVSTTAPTSDPPSTITDATFQAMWNVTNSNGNFEHIGSIFYDSATGLYPYQRAVGSTTIIADTLQSVLNEGNVANNSTAVNPNNQGTIQLDDVSVTPTRTTLLRGFGVTSQNHIVSGTTSGAITLNAPATVTNYSLTLPAAQSSDSNNVIFVSTAGVASFNLPTLALKNYDTWTVTTFASTANYPVETSVLVVSGNVTSQITSGTVISFNSLGSPSYTVTNAVFNTPNSTITILGQTIQAIVSGSFLYLPGTITNTRFDSVNLSSGLLGNVTNRVLNVTSYGGAGGGNLQKTLNLGNTASTASGGVASFTLTDTQTNASTTINPSVVITERIRLTAVGVTGTVDLRNSGGNNSYIISFPNAQSNSDFNFIGINSTGALSFTLPTIGNVTFTNWANTSRTNVNQLNAGTETFNINGDASSVIRAGDTISWSPSGVTSYIVEQSVFNAGTNLTNVLLFTPLVNVVNDNSPIYKGTINTTSERLNALQIGNGLEGSFTNGILTILNTASGGTPGATPSFDQVTAVGANSVRSISVQPSGFNGIGLLVPPTLSASPQIVVLGTQANAGLAIVTRGSGALLFGSSNLTFATESHVFTTAGITIDAIPDTGGATPVFTYLKQVSVYDAIGGSGIDIIGGNSRKITSSSGNNDLTVMASGSGNLTLGNIADSGIQITGGISNSCTLQVVGAASSIGLNLTAKGGGSVILGNNLNALTISMTTTRVSLTPSLTPNADLVFIPSGNGDLYPIGIVLSGVTANQPTINVAAGQGLTNVGPGTAGQVMTSNGTAGSPYWGNSYNFYNNQAVFTFTAANQQSGVFSFVPVVRFNNLGLSTSTNTITGFVTSALYRLDLMAGVNTSQAVNSQFFFSIITSNNLSSNASYGSGVTVSIIRTSSVAQGDVTNSTGIGYLTGQSTLYCWMSLSVTTTNVNNLILCITRLL